MQEILQAMPNVQSVAVTRSGPDEEGGYIWTITFLSPAGAVPQLSLATSSLTGAGAGVLINTPVPGNVISGYFTLQVCFICNA